MYTVRRMCVGGISNTPGGGGGKGKRKVRTGVSWGKLKERGHVENLGIDVKMIIRQTFKKWAVKARTGLIWLRIGAVPLAMLSVSSLKMVQVDRNM
jgi:hypothetical protein